MYKFSSKKVYFGSNKVTLNRNRKIDEVDLTLNDIIT